jgi:hypothetical protein
MMPGLYGCVGIPRRPAQSAKALSLAQQLAHPFTLARTLYCDAILCQLRRDVQAVRDQGVDTADLQEAKALLDALA